VAQVRTKADGIIRVNRAWGGQVTSDIDHQYEPRTVSELKRYEIMTKRGRAIQIDSHEYPSDRLT
jgi:hypothetical protein